ncbi:Transcriptional regulator, LuxR family [Frankia sp. Hr75.2]|nr:Transcriptional regulator, LuxR family [Frankia sp. Hr75.2]
MDLLERDREVAVVRAAIDRAAAGQRSGAAVTGESGAGKSALLAAARAAVPGPRFLLGGCDPLLTPRPLGPFRDIAAAAGLGPLLPGEDRVRGEKAGDSGAELSLAGVCERIYEALRDETTVLVVEDLHWVDAASVEVLRFLARRVDAMSLALLVSYRDDEIGPGHSARPLLGDFARLAGLRTLDLRPLSLDAVRAVVGGTRLEPSRVHELTGGNPFFVTEIAKEPDRPLPTSVRDAVLARTTDVTLDDVEVLQMVATAPDRLDDRVLPALGVDLPTLRRLDTTGLLTRARGGLVFRHELARQAVESTIPPGGAPGCTPACWPRWSESSRAIPPSSPTTRSWPATGPGRPSTRRPPPARRSRPVRTARRRRSSGRRWSTSERRPRSTGPTCSTGSRSSST